MALHVMDEANRCLGCKVPQCQKGCPIGTPIPEVIRLLKNNQLDEAGRILFENNPLTTVCSLVCNHENQFEYNKAPVEITDEGVIISISQGPQTGSYPLSQDWKPTTMVFWLQTKQDTLPVLVFLPPAMW